MSKISFERIIPLIHQKASSSGVVELLREIIVLQARLENRGVQDFYLPLP